MQKASRLFSAFAGAFGAIAEFTETKNRLTRNKKMKRLNLFLKIFIAIACVAIVATPATPQSGNQSDVTGPLIPDNNGTPGSNDNDPDQPDPDGDNDPDQPDPDGDDDIDTPTPNLGQSPQNPPQGTPGTPNLGQSPQNPPQGTPNLGQSPQNPPQGIPNLGQSPENPPQGTPGTPNLGQSPQNPPQGTPNLGQSPQNPPQGTPNLGQSPENPPQGTPSSGQSPQNPAPATPNLGQSPQNPSTQTPQNTGTPTTTGSQSDRPTSQQGGQIVEQQTTPTTVEQQPTQTTVEQQPTQTEGQMNGDPQNIDPPNSGNVQIQRPGNIEIKSPSMGVQTSSPVDRPAYERQLQQSDVSEAVELLEEYQAVEFSSYLGIPLFGKTTSVEVMAQTLYELSQASKKKSAVIYVSSLSNQLKIVVITPNNVSQAHQNSQLFASTSLAQGILDKPKPSAETFTVDVSSEEVQKTLNKFREDLTHPSKRRSEDYLQTARQLYQWIIEPIEAKLQENEIDILAFSMDSGLRGIPISALHDGERFLIEKYAVALIPSFGLTDISYSDVRQRKILGMGAATFTDNLDPLPAVPVELQTIVNTPWPGELFLNEGFTSENFKQQNKQEAFGIIHLATHAKFNGGNVNNSYIQFFERKVYFNQFRDLVQELGWSSSVDAPIELLVLSACKTAAGNPEAELGFAGLALLSGVKTALASLWYVNDIGTLGLMTQFYHELRESPIKAEALRKAQLAMLNGEVRFENGVVRLPNGQTLPLPPELAQNTNLDLSHPYFWSAFTTIGNWN